MEDCNDCWCEHYGKNYSVCDQCKEKGMNKEKPELRVILKKRAVEQMGITEPEKSKSQTR